MSTLSPLSVAVCAYNGLEYTKLLISSLRRHSRYDHEILVYSDGSSDGTRDWLRTQNGIEYQHDPRNRGICTAMNRVARMATREYLFFPNTDHVVAPGWDDALLRRLAPRTVVSCQCIEPGIVPVAPIFHAENCGTRFDNFDETRFLNAADRLRRDEAVPGINYPFAISKSLWEELEGLDERFNPGPANDPDLFYRLRLCGAKMVRANDSLIYHFSGKSSRLAGEAQSEHREWHEVTERNEDRFVEKWGERYRYANGGTPDPGPEARKRWQVEHPSAPPTSAGQCIAIDARAGTRDGGIGAYTLRLVEALLTHDDGLRVLCLTDDLEGLRTRIAAREGLSLRLWSPAAPRAAAQLSSILAEAGASLFHGPSFELPEKVGLPAVVTIHDLAFQRHPEWYPDGFASHMDRITRSSVERATIVIAVSDTVRKDIVRTWPAHAHKVVRIHEAPVLKPTEEVDLHAVEDRPFVLAVGVQQRRKNAVGLVNAFSMVSGVSEGKLKLVLVGGVDCEDPRLLSTIQDLKLESAVRLTGKVSDAALRSLYSRAAVVVLASLDEGFGLPALEALEAGTPVVATRAGALPEILGDAARFVPAGDVEALVAAIQDVVADDSLRADLVQRGRERASFFSWEKVARETLAAYRKALGAAPVAVRPEVRRTGPLRIGVDARLLGMDHLGTGRYTRHILEGLFKHAPDVQWVLVGPRALPEIEPWSRASIALHVPAGGETLLDPAWEQFTLPSQLQGCDLFFSPTSILPVTAPCRSVTVIHDLGFEDRPQFYDPLLRRHLQTWVRKSCLAADRLVAVSAFTKDRLAQVYGIPGERIHVVHHGALHRSSSTSAPRKNPYILCVSSFEPNKNQELLIEAFARVAPSWKGSLVLAGRRGRHLEPLKSKIASLRLASRVDLVEEPDDKALADLYSGAALFAFPSLYEGFGLPLLEAMGAGRPVVANRVASCPEVVGDAGVLLDEATPDAWACALLNILSSPDQLRSLGDIARARASTYSWDTAAHSTWEVIQESLSSA